MSAHSSFESLLAVTGFHPHMVAPSRCASIMAVANFHFFDGIANCKWLAQATSRFESVRIIGQYVGWDGRRK
eukprot:scaffold130494_cov25-Prasinocladus_malaysianus.AAC.2